MISFDFCVNVSYFMQPDLQNRFFDFSILFLNACGHAISVVLFRALKELS